MPGGQDFGRQFIEHNFALRASGVRGEFLKVHIKRCQYHRRAVVRLRVRNTHIHKYPRLTFTFFNHMPREGPTLCRIKILTVDATCAILWVLEDTAPVTHHGTPIAMFIAIDMLSTKFGRNRLHFVAAQRDPIAATGTTIRAIVTR